MARNIVRNNEGNLDFKEGFMDRHAGKVCLAALLLMAWLSYEMGYGMRLDESLVGDQGWLVDAHVVRNASGWVAVCAFIAGIVGFLFGMVTTDIHIETHDKDHRPLRFFKARNKVNEVLAFVDEYRWIGLAWCLLWAWAFGYIALEVGADVWNAWHFEWADKANYLWQGVCAFFKKAYPALDVILMVLGVPAFIGIVAAMAYGAGAFCDFDNKGKCIKHKH